MYPPRSGRLQNCNLRTVDETDFIENQALFKNKRRQSVFHQFAHWFLNDLTPWVTGVAQAHPEWCFPIAFVVAFSESFVGVSFVIPGTTLLWSLGIVIGASDISIIPAWTGAVIGSILGDWISYWIGFHYHHQILHIWPFRNYEDQLEKGLHFFHRFGTWAIFLGRFLGPFRATVPLVAGMSELEFWPFQIANTASAILWAFALLILGIEGFALFGHVSAFLHHLLA